MTKQEILDRIKDILYQDGNVQALDLLKHDLENDIIEEDKKWFKVVKLKNKRVR